MIVEWYPTKNLELAQQGAVNRLHLPTIAFVQTKFIEQDEKKAHLLEDILLDDEINPDLKQETKGFQKPFPEQMRGHTSYFHNRSYETLYELASLFEAVSQPYNKKDKVGITPNFAAGVLGRHVSTTKNLMDDLFNPKMHLPFELKPFEADEYGVVVPHRKQQGLNSYASTDESRYAGSEFRGRKKAFKTIRSFRKFFENNVWEKYGNEGIGAINTIDETIKKRISNLEQRGLLSVYEGEIKAGGMVPKLYHIVGSMDSGNFSESYSSIGPKTKEVSSFPKSMKFGSTRESKEFWDQEIEAKYEKRIFYGTPDNVKIGDAKVYTGTIHGNRVKMIGEEDEKILVEPRGRIIAEPFEKILLKTKGTI